jgi:predicted TIM-barrel fold metal-dependent hydrolase
MREGLTRRCFLAGGCAALAAGADEIIDIHQHTPYSGRTADELVRHQKIMGVSRTIMLPAGSKFGLAADAGGNEVVQALVRAHPQEYVFCANEVAGLPQTRAVIEKNLKAGALGIAEQKFHVDCDSREMQEIFDITRDYRVPVLLHFQHETYNMGFERFHKMLEKYPTVNFIGHAQTWWGNIDRNHKQEVMYPKGPVTPGGITDRLLSDYPNMYGDLSAGSGLNALARDEDHARGFLKRHQDRLIYGSDCSDRAGEGKLCSGAQQLAQVRRLAPDAGAIQKMFSGNARRVFKMA